MGSRFCSCDVSDGTSSFVCEKCKKIKKTSKKVVKRAIKKSKVSIYAKHGLKWGHELAGERIFVLHVARYGTK